MKHHCENCRLRAKFDSNERSLLGRIWRFHADFCPGWKRYMLSLPETKRLEIAQKYNQRKFLK